MKLTRPAITSVRAGALPRNGTCVILAPESVSTSAAARCAEPPFPAEAYDTSPGFAFAACTTSWTELNGASARVTMTSGRNETRLIGAKSLIGSYGFLSASRIAFTLCESVVMRIV